MADASTAFVVLACAQGALTLALVGATTYYARKTHDIASATRDQAEASLRMAEASEASRLGMFQPRVRLFARVGNIVEGAPEVMVTVQNQGRGPARNCYIAIAHPKYRLREGFIPHVSPGESSEVILCPETGPSANSISQDTVLMADYQSDIEDNWYQTTQELDMPDAWVNGYGKEAFLGPSTRPFRKELANDS